jgi:hypothetical protein
MPHSGVADSGGIAKESTITNGRVSPAFGVVQKGGPSSGCVVDAAGVE